MTAGNRIGFKGTGGASGLGTFSGVFTPSILTILGIILFLRMGFVVGHAGLGRALLIIAMANVISLLTSISLSAVATNIKVRGGGDYYLISRTLGIEFGGALGLVLFLAQSVSIAFYAIGFGEAAAGMLPGEWGISARIIAFGVVAFLLAFAWLGADWAARLQFVVMAVLFAALVVFFTGGARLWSGSSVVENWAAPEGGMDFWVLFALFFPAVTGFTQGVSMSGDLKDAGKSIPLGTFTAVGLSIVVYFAVAVVFAGAVPLTTLRDDLGAMAGIASVGWLIDAGVVAATLSSAMASFMGAPRILQSLAKDGIFPVLSPFAVGAGPTENPRRGVLLSAVIAICVTALGDLDLVAPVISMFFLISYALLNYATYYEARGASPSFRPRFRFFNGYVSLGGALACGGAMLMIHPPAAIAGLAVIFAIHQYLRRTAGPARWADGAYSYHFQLARGHLLAMRSDVVHPRDWRPQFVVFSADPAQRKCLTHFASWLEGGSGLTTVLGLVRGAGKAADAKCITFEESLRAEISEEGIAAFARVMATPDPERGAPVFLQSHGVGPLEPNTLLMGWGETPFVEQEKLEEGDFGRQLLRAHRLGKNVVALASSIEAWNGLSEAEDGRRIDLWWLDSASGKLMVLLAHLMRRHEDWDDCQIRILAQDSKNREGHTEGRLAALLEETRISVDVVVVKAADEACIVKESGDASLVFLPIRLKGVTPVGPFGESLDGLIAALPPTGLFYAAEVLDLDADIDEDADAAVEEAEAKEEDAS